MKIKRIKYKNHPVLGDLELYLADSNGIPFDTIVLVGENGAGKTTVLDSISNFLKVGNFLYFDFIEYIIDGKELRIAPVNHPNAFPGNPYPMPSPINSPVSSHAHVGYEIFDSYGNKIQASNAMMPHEGNNSSDIRSAKCVFSRARSDFKTNPINSTTNKELDNTNYDNELEEDFTGLKQLIIDVQSQDNDEYATRNRAGIHLEWERFYPDSKMFRFQNAFDSFFDKIKYDRVESRGSEKAILFKKNGKSIEVDRLSTGEKQIVFRGISLLKNSKRMEGAAIMIDEPELSMHPKWMRKILKYYKDIFFDGVSQKAQLFFATHSDHVLKEALSDQSANLVIVLEDDNGLIKAKKINAPGVLPSITYAETNYLAFDIVSNDYHIELYGWLQQKESIPLVKMCDEYIKRHAAYDSKVHSKSSVHGRTTYDTLTTYIRNAIDHPDISRQFTEDELRVSTELLIDICR